MFTFKCFWFGHEFKEDIWTGRLSSHGYTWFTSATCSRCKKQRGKYWYKGKPTEVQIKNFLKG